jgi:hypothetical protein
LGRRPDAGDHDRKHYQDLTNQQFGWVTFRSESPARGAGVGAIMVERRASMNCADVRSFASLRHVQ